jgi:hypothetical protein
VRIKAGGITTATDSHIFILPNGNVGIGTVTPAAKLDVNGTANFSGLVTFASGQTFPGTGNGTITGVTAGTGLSGGGSSGNVGLSVDSSVARTNASNTFTAPQTVNGALTATSFNGSGAGLTNIPPASLAPGTLVNETVLGSNISGHISDTNLPPDVALLGAANSFTSPQKVTTSTIGYAFSVSNLGNSGSGAVSGTSTSSGTDGLGVYGAGGNTGVLGVSPGGGYGVVGTSVSGVGVYGASGSGGIAGLFNISGSGKLLSGIQNSSSSNEVFSVSSNGSVNASGNLTTAGSVTIGGGTAITKHISALFQNVAFNTKLSPNTCTVWPATISGAADGDTVAVGIGSSLMTANIVYSAWATNGAVQVRICNPTGSPTTVGAGNIRVDLWRH